MSWTGCCCFEKSLNHQTQKILPCTFLEVGDSLAQILIMSPVSALSLAEGTNMIIKNHRKNEETVR